jgi:hypothetical protein
VAALLAAGSLILAKDYIKLEVVTIKPSKKWQFINKGSPIKK